LCSPRYYKLFNAPLSVLSPYILKWFALPRIGLHLGGMVCAKNSRLQKTELISFIKIALFDENPTDDNQPIDS